MSYGFLQDTKNSQSYAVHAASTIEESLPIRTTVHDRGMIVPLFGRPFCSTRNAYTIKGAATTDIQLHMTK